CHSCFNFGDVLCKICIADVHSLLPFHSIKRWNGNCGEKITLFDLRLQLHLCGHSCQRPCMVQSPPETFVVLDVTGIHTVALRLCQCQHTLPLREQLLHSHLWPATVGLPQTAASFKLLENFQLLSFMSKVSAEEMYHTLKCLTDKWVPQFHW
ncbi:hypothetical protein GYMLUDRAFT_157098, partial [Collybiopsis luxurians FD-317 M1]